MFELPSTEPRNLERLRFPFEVEVQLPKRAAMRETMHRWCLGKPYRMVPSAGQPGQVVRWLFTRADDADFFQATFGGKLIFPKD
jgi:hypothetical protein